MEKSFRYLDEAGDTTFYGKGKIPIIGNVGVSKAFYLGITKLKEDTASVRNEIIKLRNRIVNDRYFQDIPSIKKKIQKKGFYFHAKDDIPEARKLFFEFINEINCSFEIIVARKIPSLYEKNHKGKESYFYADLLSHLLKNKFNLEEHLHLTIAQRGNTTRNNTLSEAVNIAKTRFQKKFSDKENFNLVLRFDVQNHYTEPILDISDYLCWAVQRVFERGDARFYNFIKEKISLVFDVYDFDNYEGSRNYYKPSKPLTKENEIKK